ncbi:putative zinc-type alcohol dehydrogenase AdhD [Actinomadura sp. NBRC 104425]|uniref:Zn-dependent alcohol dehydrogenase n=1 Tax=Actinomadura sp. NBRC 104425 TaxID=3032204 RepID=UPI0024A060B1|nr:Zn-dependent alcohol dehydrogenase [Actinomadura sp. NBRC 104425]GLZ15779.1 putative zinc-type alcohol dehydrogenase AdhD [Actinomadura sp. NBRC 104425]
MTESAVLERPNQPLRILEVDLEAPRAGEVKVEIGATGVCHSDISVFTANLPNPMPVVLGHEGAGTVVEVGTGVTDLAPGDRVVLSWLAQCGECFFCVKGQPQLCETAGVAFSKGALLDGSTRYSRGGRGIYQMAGLGTFSRHCVVPARSAIKIPATIPLTSAALIGCGVLTGWGAAVNTAGIRVGDTVAVLGCGGVGLSAVQGARMAGASIVIAVDMHDERLDLARRLGATHTIKAGGDTAKEVRAVSGGRGVDVALEVVGRQETIDDAVRMTRRGGQVVLVGAGGPDVRVSVPAFTGVVMTEKVIRGSLYGSSDVKRDVPRLIGLYEAGLLKLDELVTEVFPFEKVNEAVDYCLSERGARAVMRF